MPGWKKVLTQLAYNAEQRMDELRYRLHYALGGPGPVKIIAYRGYGTPEQLFLRGRVLEDKNIPEAERNDNLWDNIVNMYKRMESDEVPNARLVARFGYVEQEIVANQEGYFEISIEPRAPLSERQLWHPIELELIDPIPKEQSHAPVKEIGQVLVPPPTARHVVVSDIDDTVLQSDATHMLKMARNVFLGNAHTRLPFPGVAALYRALFTGKSGTEMNPLFYVSSSPWNLYDLLSQFFNLQGIPVGPVLFLRDWGVTPEEILPIKHKEYKMRYIKEMLDFYTDMPFILIGDSGQEDPEIYAELVTMYPKRIQAVYIRNVTRDLKRPEMVRELAKSVVEAGSALVLADDTVAIAKHAIEMGFISPEAMASIQNEKRKDEAPPTPIEKLLGEDTQAEAPTIKVEGRTTTETKNAVEEGTVEEVVKEAGKETTKQPPTVVVEGKDAKKQKKEQK